MFSYTKIKNGIAFLLLLPILAQSQIRIPVKSTAGPAESGSGVSSFNSRTGAVSPVEADYSAYFPSISRFLDSLTAVRSSISVADNSITNAKLADMAGNTIKGRLTSTGDPQDLTVTQVKTLLSQGRGAEWEMVEDFYSGYLTSNFILFNGNGGTATAAPIYATDQRGNARLSTGNSSASAYSHLTTYDNSFTFNATTYAIDVKDVVISDLNTGSDSSAYLIGFWDNLFSNGNPGDGAYIAYVQTEGTWRCVTSFNGARSVTSSGVNVGRMRGELYPGPLLHRWCTSRHAYDQHSNRYR